VKILGHAIHAAVDPEHDDQLSASQELQEITRSCHNVLSRLEKELDQFVELGPSQGAGISIKDRLKRGWQRFQFDAAEIRNVREQLTSHLQSFNTVQIHNNRFVLISPLSLLYVACFGTKLMRWLYISKHIKSIVVGVDKLNLREDEEERQRKRNEVLDWVTQDDYNHTHHDITNRRCAGTGQWFLNSDEYQSWLGSTGQTLYCPGLPGAGKTTLTAIVIDDLMTRFSQTPDNNVGIAYIYFNFKTQTQQTQDNILASLLKQLSSLKESIPEHVQKLYDQLQKAKRRLTHFDIKQNLETVAKTFPKVFIALDALDECQFNTMSHLMKDLFDLQKACNVTLFATSRNIPRISAEFSNPERPCLSMEIRASEEDVLKYLDGQMHRLRPFARRNKDLQGQISTAIANSVQGMFLLAQLFFEPLVGTTTKNQVLRALTQLPSGSDAYNHAYKEAMLRIEGQGSYEVDLARNVLAWITCAKRPLRVLELQHALAVREGEDRVDEGDIPEVEDIVGVCAGLVTVDEQSNIIRLVHYTTQEYFQRTQKEWFPDGESDLGIACLRYISFPIFESTLGWRKLCASNPLYRYACNNWGYHLGTNWEACKELLGAFQKSDKKVAAAAETMSLASPYDLEKPSAYYTVPWADPTGLHLMVYFGLHQALELFLDDWESPDEKTSAGGWTLLAWAAVYGHEDVARLLISRGAKVKTWDHRDRTPLWLACYYGHTKVVELLLESGANPRARDDEWKDPMMAATMKGHQAVVKAILAKDPLSAFSYERKTRTTTLMYASGNHDEEIVRMLLGILNGRTIPVSRFNRCGETALSLAVWATRDSTGDRMAVIQLLLDAGAICHSGFLVQAKHRYWASEPPLLCPAKRGQADLLKLLLDRGTKTEAVDRFGRTPLSWAAEHHKPSSPVLDMLLAAGANTEAKDKCGWTPLFYATSEFSTGHDAGVDAFRILRRYKADVNTRDIAGRTPLMHAVYKLYKCDEEERRHQIRQHVRRVVAAGARLDAQDVNGTMAVEDAIALGDQEVVEFLRESGSKSGVINVERWISGAKARHANVGAIYVQAGWRLRGG